MYTISICESVFFFNDTATTEIYTLSLHDALPILRGCARRDRTVGSDERDRRGRTRRSEEHTSELQSRGHLVCRLLLEKKKKISERYHSDFHHTKLIAALELTLRKRR